MPPEWGNVPGDSEHHVDSVATSPPPVESGGVIIPVAGVSYDDLADTFGADRSGGREHAGIDIFADEGTPVLATVSGTVTNVGTIEMGGNRLWLVGDDGNAYYYAHLQEFGPDIEPGETVQVEAGQVIGYVGNTGNASTTPPHLHFSVNSDIGSEEGVINPYEFLTGATTAAEQGHTPTGGIQVGTQGNDPELEIGTGLPEALLEAEAEMEQPQTAGTMLTSTFASTAPSNQSLTKTLMQTLSDKVRSGTTRTL